MTPPPLPALVSHRDALGLELQPDTGTVLYQESIAFAQASPDNSMIMRLLTVDADGGERLLGEYAFHHTRTIPGPAGW